MYYVNQNFEILERKYPNVTRFDVEKAPLYDPNTEENGIFKEDFVHYTPKTNRYVAQCILKQYRERRRTQ